MRRHIIFAHLLNDFSGSPRVLKSTIAASKRGVGRLYLGSSDVGILSDCGIPINHYWYCRSHFRIITLLTYLLSQAVLFCKLLCDREIARDAVIFVSTLLPFGAALYGKLTGRKVIYHIHESSISPALLKFFLVGIAQCTSQFNIYVSDTHMQTLPIRGISAQRVYNALDADFVSRANASTYVHRHTGNFNILMIASLRDYKGIPELLALADSLHLQTDIRFTLVVNDNEAAIMRYFSGRKIPSNLTLYPQTSDTTTFYARASLVMNLSRVDQCVETFGLTVLEAMTFGIPVVVPPVGGPAELVVNGVHGFHVDSYNKTLLREKVLLLYEEKELCLRMSKACRARAAEFSPDNFAANILAAIDHVRDADE